MKSILVEKQIDAPVHDVFAVMSDIPNAANTISGITDIEMLTEDPVGVGTRWRETRIMFGKSTTEEMGITAFTPDESYVVESDSCGTRYRSTIRFLESHGGTKVQMEFGATPQSLFAKMMQPLGGMFAGTIRKCLLDDLNDAKLACESRVAS